MEKRIEQIILASITKVLSGEPSDFDYEIAASLAADAVADKMRKGTVLEVDGQIVLGDGYRVSVPGVGRLVIPNGRQLGIQHGQRVRITVKIEGGGNGEED